MRFAHFWPLLAFLAVGSAPASAGDLTKIDRTIAKEPAYKNKPKYCLVVFGTDAKTRIWLVQDGDVLYVDRNGNGDLTEKDELLRADEPQDTIAREYGAEPGDRYRRWTVGDITSADGKTKYGKMELDICRDTWGFHHRAEYIEYLPRGFRLTFADRPRDAPIVPFAGPVAAHLRTHRSLVRGQTQCLNAALGTRGLGKGAFAIACICDDEPKLIGEIEFPPKAPDAAPIKVKLTFGRY